MTEMSLKSNQLPDNYVYDPREGKLISPDQLLPPVGKQRTEVIHFMEGVHWLTGHLVGFKADIPDVMEAALKRAKELYPAELYVEKMPKRKRNLQV
jgi:hypothetical protein